LLLTSLKIIILLKKEIEINDLNIDEILLLQDGHCFRDGF
jgi:hypothetical protein